MPNEEVYIVDDTGRRVEAGAVGELVVRGSNVMKGYWELPEETDRVLHTGDLFRIDEEGYLYFVGRKDDIIKTRGEKVSPREVEDVLHAMPGVAEAAVIGIPDEVLGEAIHAVIRPQAGANLTAEDVIRWCSLKLENFMVPKSVDFQGEFPKTSTGKISKRELAKAKGISFAIQGTATP
jgi:acyl-CoA synthetase (AMP-forming)/AMP-acid ligase II